MQVDLQTCLVAERQEARTGRGQRHRIAHDDVSRRVPDFVVAPGHRHDTHGAIEVRHLELGLCGAVSADLHDAGV